MNDIVETLRTMADNIDATRPEGPLCCVQKKVDDADIATLREAADLIEALRKANAEVFETGIKSVRDTAELAIELREVKKERVKLAAQLDEYRECFTDLAKERDGLWSDLERVTKERDEARRMACEALAAGDDDEASEYARLRNWDCFSHTDGASCPENPDKSQQALDRLARLDEEIGL